MSLLHLILIINTFFGLLAQEIKKENHVLSPEDRDIDSINVEEILKQLRMERAKNKNLNQTILDILEEMEDMKKNIMRNEEKITENQSSVFLLTRDVDDLTEGLPEFRMRLPMFPLHCLSLYLMLMPPSKGIPQKS